MYYVVRLSMTLSWKSFCVICLPDVLACFHLEPGFHVVLFVGDVGFTTITSMEPSCAVVVLL